LGDLNRTSLSFSVVVTNSYRELFDPYAVNDTVCHNILSSASVIRQFVADQDVTGILIIKIFAAARYNFLMDLSNPFFFFRIDGIGL